MKKNNNSQIHSLIIILLVLNLIVALAWLLKTDGAIKLEKLRAWWAENFAAIMDFYKSDQYKQQQNESIPMLLEQMAGSEAWTNNNQPPQAQEPTQGQNSVSVEAINNILADGYIQGNTEARYTVLEYSDFECPFCKRHHDNGTIQALIDTNPDTVNYMLRHFPLQNHPNAQIASEATECAAELQGAESFYDMKAAIFTLDNVTRDGIIQVATWLGINQSDFISCLDSGKYTEKVKAQMAEWQSLFGVRGTPGNVIIDTETGRFVAIPWAFPLEKFEEELQILIANE